MTKRMMTGCLVSLLLEVSLLLAWLLGGLVVAGVVLGAILIVKVELLAVTTPNWPPWAAPGEHSRWLPHL